MCAFLVQISKAGNQCDNWTDMTVTVSSSVACVSGQCARVLRVKVVTTGELGLIRFACIRLVLCQPVTKCAVLIRLFVSIDLLIESIKSASSSYFELS